MRRDCSARCGEIKPVICFNGAASIRGCAALRSFPQVHGNKPCRIAVKKRCDIIEKLPTNILGGRHPVPEGGVIFVQKAMVIAMVNDFTGAFLDFADVDQHSGSGIGLTAENKVGHIVAAGAVTRCAFFTEKLAVLFCGEFRRKQPTRSGEFDAFADGQQHDKAIPTTRNRANNPRVFRSERVVCLQPAERTRLASNRQSGLDRWRPRHRELSPSSALRQAAAMRKRGRVRSRRTDKLPIVRDKPEACPPVSLSRARGTRIVYARPL